MRWIAWTVTLLAVLTASAAATAKVYKWTDARGQTHYSELPPIGRPTQALDIQTSPAQPRPVASKPTTIAAPMKPSDQASAGQGEGDQRPQPLSQDPQSPHPTCTMARQNLQYLEGPSNRQFRDSAGHVVRYTETQRQAKIAAAKHYLEQHCSAR